MLPRKCPQGGFGGPKKAPPGVGPPFGRGPPYSISDLDIHTKSYSDTLRMINNGDVVGRLNLSMRFLYDLKILLRIAVF